MKVSILLAKDYMDQKRARYSLWHALGDVGGFHDGLILFVRLVLSPLAAHRFYVDLV